MTQLTLTKHAITRYHERVEPLSPAKELRFFLEPGQRLQKIIDACPDRPEVIPPEWLSKHVSESNRDSYLSLDEETCFLLKDEVVITVFTKQEEERRHGETGQRRRRRRKRPS